MTPLLCVKARVRKDAIWILNLQSQLLIFCLYFHSVWFLELLGYQVFIVTRREGRKIFVHGVSLNIFLWLQAPRHLMPGQTALDDGQADKLLAGLAQDAKSPLLPRRTPQTAVSEECWLSPGHSSLLIWLLRLQHWSGMWGTKPYVSFVKCWVYFRKDCGECMKAGCLLHHDPWRLDPVLWKLAE